jgi:uncharacterized iron-regulated membrane protein
MNLWNRWLRQPQNIWLRRALFQVHLWIGISIGLYILMISVTGSLLVYRREMAAAITTVHVTPVPHRLTKDELNAVVHRAYPEFSIEQISIPRLRGQIIPDQAIEVEVRRGGEIHRRFFDPYNGADLGDSGRQMIARILWLADLHDDLLFIRHGRKINGIGAILSTILAMTGAILWWPGIRTWRRGLKIEWNRKRYGFQWSLHNFLGLWFFLFVLLWGISGIYLCFPGVFDSLVEYLDPTKPVPGQLLWGEEILSWLAKLHFGRFSLPIKALWTVLGLVPAVLTFTGTMMWWYRVVRRESRNLELAEATAIGSTALRPQSALNDTPTTTV